MPAGRNLDLVRHMQYFLAVAEHQHFARAAESLGISQPPLSQGVQRLERRLGTTLFDRRGTVELTAHGVALVPRARALVAAAAAIVADTDASRGAFTLGVVPQLPAGRAAGVIRRLRAHTGSEPPSVVTAGSVHLIAQVADGHLDAALVVHPAVLDGVSAEPSVTRLRTWALLPDGHPAAAARSVRLVDLAGPAGLPLAIAARSDNPAAYDLTRDLAAASGLRITSAPVPDDRAAVLAVASGRCIALTADGRLTAPGCARVAIAGDPLPLRLRLVWPASPSGRADPPVRSALTAALDSWTT